MKPLCRWKNEPIASAYLPWTASHLFDVVRVAEHRRVVLVQLREHVVGREDERVVDCVGIELYRLVLDAFDRRDVAGPEGELRRDLRVVDEVHVRRGGRHAASESG